MNTETIKLTKPQRELLDLLQSWDHQKMGVSCVRDTIEALLDDRYALMQRIAELEAALRLHKAWFDSESAGPNYGGQTRATHPHGDSIWRQWWDGNLDLCDRARRATDAALQADEAAQ